MSEEPHYPVGDKHVVCWEQKMFGEQYRYEQRWRTWDDLTIAQAFAVRVRQHEHVRWVILSSVQEDLQWQVKARYEEDTRNIQV